MVVAVVECADDENLGSLLVIDGVDRICSEGYVWNGQQSEKEAWLPRQRAVCEYGYDDSDD